VTNVTTMPCMGMLWCFFVHPAPGTVEHGQRNDHEGDFPWCFYMDWWERRREYSLASSG